MAPNRNRFRLTRFFIFALPSVYRLLARFRSTRKRLLIIKPHAIGDHVLFRNFIEAVANSRRYKGYEIDLVANEICKELVEAYDHHHLDRCFFIRPYQLYYQPLQVFKIGWRLFRRSYDVVLEPSSTRLLITDGIAAFTAAKTIIGYESDTEAIEAKYKKRTDRFYSRLLKLPVEVYHEFHRNKFFFETVLNEAIDMPNPTLPYNTTVRDGIVLVPGAGIPKRGWETEKFVSLIRSLLQETTAKVVIAGSPADVEMNAAITSGVSSGRLVDLTAKTSLPQLVQLIASAKLLIANDSGAAHMAVATGTPSVIITGGGHFERFVPYPPEMQTMLVAVYQKLECYYCNWNCIYQTADHERYPCVSVVTVQSVLDEAIKVLATS